MLNLSKTENCNEIIKNGLKIQKSELERKSHELSLDLTSNLTFSGSKELIIGENALKNGFLEDFETGFEHEEKKYKLSVQ